MFEQVKQEIDDKIKTNGNNEITATRLNGVLQDMMDAAAEEIGEVATALQPVHGATENNFASFDSNGEIKDSTYKAADFAPIAQAVPIPQSGDAGKILGYETQGGVQWVSKPSDGKSALQIYNETYGTNLNEEQFIDVLKQNYPMEYVAYDATAAAQTIGTGFASIGTLAADSTTAGKMYLMPNDGTTPTGTILFVTVQTGISTYVWYKLGDLGVPSNVLTEDDIVNDLSTGGANKPASAETVKTLANLSSDVVLEDVDLSGKQSGYYNAHIGDTRPENLTSGTFYTTNIAVQAGEVYVGTSRTSAGAGFCQFIFWDADDKCILVIKNNSVSEEHTQSLVVPDSAVLMSFCGLSSSSSYPYELKKQVLYGIKQRLIDLENTVDGLEEQIAPLDEKIDGVIEEVVSKNLFDKSQTIDGKTISTGGAIMNKVETWSYGKVTPLIPVQAGKVYCISGSTVKQAKRIRCLDNSGIDDANHRLKVVAANTNDTTISNWDMPLPDGSGAASDMNQQFKIPQGAAYLQFVTATYAIDSTDTIMLELVGDSYNPNFVPSQYQEYGNEVFIKNSAIDCDENVQENSDKPVTSRGVYEALQNVNVGKSLKVLLIGSSHGVNTISMFPVLAKKAGINVVCGNLYSGSATIGLYSRSPAVQIPYMAANDVEFSRFAINDGNGWTVQSTKTVAYALSLYDWDVIILQRGASEDYWNESISGFYQKLLDYIKDNCDYTPKIYFNSGIGSARSSIGSLRFDTEILMNTSYQQLAQFGIEVIPTALAVMYARETCLKETGQLVGTAPNQFKCMVCDSDHLDTGVGQYVTACTVFEKVCGDLFNMSLRELNYLPTYSDVENNVINVGSTYFTTITEYYARIAKTCAKLAVIDETYKQDTAAYLSTKYGSTPTTYSVTNNLTGCSSDNNNVTVSSDDVYMCTLTANTGLTISDVTVMMGGVDVTDDAYATYNGYYAIRIGNITGNIEITVIAN